MKLCFLAGANSIHSYRWIKYFAEAGHEVAWISLAPSIFESLPGVHYFEIEAGPWPIGLLRAAANVRKIVAHFQPDILHVHSVGTYGMMGLLSGFDPIIATPWGSDVIYGKKSPLKRLFIARILRRAAMITCDAWHMREEVMRFGVPAEHIHIINFGIDAEYFSPRSPNPSIRAANQLGSAPAVISLRNFEPVYDIPTLLKAVPKVLEQHPNTCFMLVGHGSLEAKLKALASQLGIDHAVRFVGFLPNDQLPDILCSLDAYVSTSLSDAGLAASTSEAMACGLPVVITDSGENALWISDGENGYLVPVSQPDALADRLNRLLGDAELRRRFGQAGRATIQARDDYRAEMGKMEALYHQVLVSKYRRSITPSSHPNQEEHIRRRRLGCLRHSDRGKAVKRLLVIANLHHASPRIPAITNYLAGFGWEITILTIPLGENPEYVLGFPDGFRDRVRIIEAPYPGDVLTTLRNLLIKMGFSQRVSFTEQIKEKFGVRKRRSWVDRALWLYQEVFGFPDGERTWRASALDVARNLMTCESFDVLLSSSPYPTSHVVASKLQRQFQIKWVADFRDTWTNNPVYSFSNARRIVESRYEKNVLRQASALTTVSEDYARVLHDLHCQPVHVIPNGYQGELVSESHSKPNEKFTLTYTGMIYVEQQAPEKPIKALKNLIDTGVIDRQDVTIRFYGRKDRWTQVLIEDLGLTDVVIQYGQIPRQEARLRQQDSELLLFLNWEDSKNKGLSHLKFYEYLRAGRPILATGGESGREVENILRETQTGIYASSDRDIERALTDLYQEYKRNGRISYKGKPESISRYSYLERAKSLNNILLSLHNGSIE